MDIFLETPENADLMIAPPDASDQGGMLGESINDPAKQVLLPENDLVDFDSFARPDDYTDVPAMPTTDEILARQSASDEEAPTDLDTPETNIDRATRMEAAMHDVAQYDLSRDAAVVLRDSARLNMSPEELLSAPDFIRQPHLTREDLIKVSNRYPTTASLLADPWIMAAFGNPNDVHELGRIEKAYGAVGRTIDRSMEAWDYTWVRDEIDLQEGWAIIFGYTPERTARLEALKGRHQTMPGPKTIKLTDEQRQNVLQGVEAAKAFIYDRFDEGPTKEGLKEKSFALTSIASLAIADLINAGAVGGAPEVGARASEVGAGMIHSLAQPETLALIGGGAVSGSVIPGWGTATGASGGAMTGFFTMNFLKGLGRGTREARERGVPEDWARVAGAFTGLMTAFTESLQVGVAVAPLKVATKKAGREATEGLSESLFKSYATEIIKRAAYETGLEMSQETLELVSQDFATMMSNEFSGTELDFYSFQDYVETNWETFKFMALGGAAVAGVGPTISLPGNLIDQHRFRQLQLAEAEARNKASEDLAKEVAAAANNSETIRTAPEAAGAIIERIAQDQDAPQIVYVEAEVLESYRQSALETDGLDWDAFEDGFLNPMGITPEQYQNALDEGISLEMPLAGIPAVAGNPIWGSLEQSEGVIRAEPRNITEEKEAAAKIVDPLDDPFNDPNFTPPPELAEETVGNLEQRLVEEAGRSEEEARAGAEIISRGVSRLLAPLGVSPNAWLNEKLSLAQAVAGEVKERLHQAAAMYRSQSESIQDFVKEAEEAPSTGAKPFFYFDNEFGDKTIEISSDQVKHVMDEHPDFHDWARIPEVIENGQTLLAGPNRVTGTESVIYTLDEDGGTLVVVAAPDVGGGGRRKKPKRTVVLTAFREKTETVNTWLRNKDAASSQSAEELQLNPHLKEMKPSGPQSGIDTIIADLMKKDKKLFQAEKQPGKAPRGWLDVLDDQRLRMTFTEAADLSTIFHEGGHVFVLLAQEVLATSPDKIVNWEAFGQLNDEFRQFAEWAGQVDPYGQWTVEAQEKAARGLETYLMEGKAPTMGLRPLFERIKSWMVDIYRSLRNLDAPLTPEVRNFFDRLLASDYEIAMEGWRTAEPEGLAPEIQAELEGPRQEARRAMEESIRQKRIAEVTRMRRQWRKEGADEADLDVNQIMMEDIIYSGGISLSSLKAGGYGSQDIAALNRKRPGLVSSKSKVGFDEYASLYGYGSDSDAFIQGLKNAPTRAQLIEDYVARQESFYADWLAEGAPVTDEEINLWILEGEAERLKGEIKTAVTGLRALKEDLKKNGGLKRFKKAMEEQAAQRTVDETSGFNMQDAKAALRKQAREIMAKASVEGYEAGARAGSYAKYLEMLVRNRVKQQNKNYIAKARARWKRFVNQDPASPAAIREGGVDPEFSVQAKKLLNQFNFDIKDRGRQEIQGTPDLGTFIKDQYDLGNDVYAPAWIQEGRWPVNSKGQPKAMGQLTFDEFQDVADTIESILHAGRENQNLLAGKNKATFDQAAGTLVAGIDQNMKDRPPVGPEPQSKSSKVAGEFAASLEKPEFIIRRFDGYEMMGPAWEILFAPTKWAEDKKIELGEKVAASLKEAWKDFTPKDRQAMGTSPMREGLTKLGEKHWLPIPKSWRVTRHSFEGAPHSLTEAEIVATFANVGNPDNLANLVEGNGFTVESLAAICDYVMARPKLMQAALDMVKAIDQLYDPLAEVNYKATGVKLDKVDPGEITLPNGTKMAGWYFPIVRDPDKSDMAYQQGQADTARETLASMGMGRRSARSGSSHRRTGAIGALSLSLDVINKHVQDVTHDITHRLAVRDIQRLLNRPDVRDAIVSHAGRQAHAQLQSWINWVAQPQSPKLDGIFAGLDWIRRNTVAATLCFNVNTPVMQLMGFSQSIDLVGFNAISKGVQDLVRDPGGVSQFVRDNSPAVRARAQGFDQDIQEVIKGLDGDAGILATERTAMIKAGFWGIKTLDYVVVYATWWGAYDKAMQEGQSFDYAKEYADTAVRMTQPLASPKDTAAIQRDPRGKFLAMYYTFFSGFHNRMLERYRGFREGKMSAADLASTVTWTIIIPTMLTWMYQNEDIPDDLDDAKSLLWDAGAYSVSGVPIIRDVVSAIGGPYRYELSPVGQVGGSISTTGSKLADAISGEGDFDEALGKSTVRSAGYIFGLPSNQALRTWDGLWKLLEGETENPVRLFKPEPRERD